MSHEVNWLRQRVDELDGSVRQARWHLNEVGACRGELAPVWSDQCARDIGLRFLDPWAAEAASTLDALHLQASTLQAALLALDLAERSADGAEEIEREMQRLALELDAALHAQDSAIQQAMLDVVESAIASSQCGTLLAEAAAAGGEA